MKTKSLVAVILIVCVLFAGTTVYLQQPRVLDYNRLYSAYEPQTEVAEVNEKEITWEEYYDVFESYARPIEFNFVQMEKYYGAKLSWTDPVGEDGTTYMDIPALYTEEYLRQEGAIYKFAGEHGTTYNPFDPDSMYTMYSSVYGEYGEKTDIKDAYAWMTENGYMRAYVIFFGEGGDGEAELLPLSELIEYNGKAEVLTAELAAIEDESERAARAEAAFKENSSEAAGSLFDKGYTFRKGTLPEEAETAAENMNAYEVSSPIETENGYFVVMRLPLDPDLILLDEYLQSGEIVTGRTMYARTAFENELESYFEQTIVEYKDGFKIPVLSDYLRREGMLNILR